MKKIFLLIPLLSSCSYGIYVPANQNVPLFHQKGEARLEVSNTYFQGAVAVGKHIGLLANVQRASGAKFMNPYAGVTKHRRAEVGVGYFRQLMAKPKVSYEAYAGVGYGYLRWDHTRSLTDWNRDTESGIFTVPNWNVFVQPAIGYRGKKAGISLSTKLDYIGYGSVQLRQYNPASNLPNDKSIVTGFAQLHSSPRLWIEPALTIRTETKRVQLSLQVCYYSQISSQLNPFPVSDGYSFMRIGLAYKLNKPLTANP